MPKRSLKRKTDADAQEIPKIKSRKSRSQRSGLVFPVGRVERLLRKRTPKFRMASGASIFLAAVLEYMTAEMLELAGNVTKDALKKRILPRHLYLCIKHDEEFSNFLKNLTIPGGGVIPRIYGYLFGNELWRKMDWKRKTLIRKGHQPESIKVRFRQDGSVYSEIDDNWKPNVFWGYCEGW